MRSRPAQLGSVAQGVDDKTKPIISEVDSQGHGRAERDPRSAQSILWGAYG